MIAFSVTAALLLGGAVLVVTTRDLVRSVLMLGVVLVLTAIAYAQLAADLLAVIQVMLYAGGVVTLILFAVMLTPRPSDEAPRIELVHAERGAFAAVFFFLLVGLAISNTPLPAAALAAPDSKGIGLSFLTTHLLAFEALSVLLLAAMIAAIVLSRRRDA